MTSTGLGGLPPMDVAGRLDRLRTAVGDATPTGQNLLVTHLTNIRYLTGFTGSAALLVVHERGAALVTDGRYEEQAADELAASGASVSVLIGRTAEVQRRLVLDALGGASSVGLEADHVTWADQRRYAASWPALELVPTSGLVESRRALKDDGEVARIERACAIADDALAGVAPLLEDRPTEAAFAQALDGEVRRLGADDISFETIVASGPNGSRPHHTPGDRTVERGDLVVVDFGALVDGYHSDMTRTIAVGGPTALTPEQQRMLAVVAESQAAGVDAVGPGVAARSVDEACRSVIEAAGWGDAFVHGTGHGVGLDVHEDPRVAATADATLVPGQVVTVEPGVYLPGHGGVRIEDTVLVTPNGRRTLTRAPKH